DLRTQGEVRYESGILSIPTLFASLNGGTLEGKASFGKINVAEMKWSSVALEPLDIRIKTQGNAKLSWSESDFRDALGAAQLQITTDEPGQAGVNITMRGRQVSIAAKGNAFKTRFVANVMANLDHELSGTFRAVNRHAGTIVVAGNIGGTF